MAELTPMMKQYLEIKENNPDSILFFRLGDFYEMFADDARTASRELDLTLTSRDKDPKKAPEERMPMCGIPYHASEAYIARLIGKGYKVAICEQVEDPATAKGLVRREVIRLSLFTFMHWRRKWQPTPVFLPGESQGQRGLMGCHLWGRTESDTTEET